MAGRASIGAKCIVSSLVIYVEITLVWTLYCAVLLCNIEFRWKITLLFVYMLNLWLHMQTPHYRSYRAGTRNMMLTFDSRPIYRALTYSAVPFLGPQQPRYIGLTLYWLHKIDKALSTTGKDFNHLCFLVCVCVGGGGGGGGLCKMQLYTTTFLKKNKMTLKK